MILLLFAKILEKKLHRKMDNIELVKGGEKNCTVMIYCIFQFSGCLSVYCSVISFNMFGEDQL